MLFIFLALCRVKSSFLKLLLWTKSVEWVKVLTALGLLCLWQFFLFDDTIQIKMITLMLLILMVIMKMKMMILMVIEIMTTAPSVLHQLKFGWKCFKLLRRSPLSAQRVHFNGNVNTDRVVMKSCILRLEALSLESILPLKLCILLQIKKNLELNFLFTRWYRTNFQIEKWKSLDWYLPL